MASNLTAIVLKIIADAKGVGDGLRPALGELDKFAEKAESASTRANKSFRSIIPPDVKQRAGVASSLASQRARESAAEQAERRSEVIRRAAVAGSLSRQREREETIEKARRQSDVARRASVSSSLARQRTQESRDAVQQGERRARITASLAEQKRTELAANPTFLKGLGQDAGGLAKGALGLGGSVLTGVVSGVVSASLSTILGTITSTATHVLSAGLDAVREGATKALTEGIAREDNEVAFGALLGSKDRGKGLVDKITQLAVDTPFNSKELLDQSKLLISYGVESEKIVGTLRQLGDVASGAGVDLGRLSLAFGQVIAKGRLQGNEIRQFTEAGVGIKDFAAAYQDTTGKRVSATLFLKLTEAGEVSAKVVERAFERMTSAGGRFFGLMESRSQTFGGRLQALKESVDVLFGKVGKSFIDNTSAGRFLDRTANQVQGIDTKGLDGFFRNIDGTLGSALTRAGNGAAGALGLSIPSASAFDFDAFDKKLRIVTDQTIPSILDAGRDVAAAFLDVGASAVRLGTLLSSLIPEDKLTAAKRELAQHQALEAVRAEKGISPRTRQTRILEGEVERIGKERAARGAELAARGEIDPVNFADTLEKAAASLRKTSPGADFRASAKLPTDFLDNILGEKGNRLLQGGVDIFSKVANDPANVRAQQEAARLNRSNRAAFQEQGGERLPSVTGPDVTNAVKALDLLGTTVKNRTSLLRDAFESISAKVLPDFAKRVEDLGARLSKPADQPFDDFRKNIQATNLLDSPLARGLGFGISKEEGTRLRGELGQELIEKFKPKDIQPAPLVRAASQESEAALTRAIYESRNTDRKPEEELKEAIIEARQVQQENNKRLEAVAAALKGENGEQNPFQQNGIGVISFPP